MLKKVNLLIMLFCIVMLFGVELDKPHNIMPQKLKYNELPENYPKELDELFNFHYAMVKEMAKIDTVTEREERWLLLQKYKSTLPYETKIKLAYLSWLAKQKITKYYYEYKWINCLSKFYVGEHFSLAEIKKLSIMPCTAYDVKTHGEFIFPEVHFKEIADKFVDYEHWMKKCFLKVKIVKLEKKDDKSAYVKMKVLDSIGDEFEEKEIIVIAKSKYDRRKKEYNLFEEGSNYVVPIMLSYRNPEHDLFEFEGKQYYIHNTYLVSYASSYELDENDVMKIYAPRPPYGFDVSVQHTSLWTLLELKAFVDWDDREQFFLEHGLPFWIHKYKAGELNREEMYGAIALSYRSFSKVPYEQFKEKLEEPINYLKLYKDVKLNNKRDGH